MMTSENPTGGEPDYLGEAHAGPGDVRARKGPGLLSLGVAAGAVVGVLALGGWAAMSFLAADRQPAEAVPADALAYVAVDLDPSAGQKFEALRIARKFPGLTALGLDADDDLRRWLFDRSGLAGCEGVDYDRDVAPWIGDRAAVAVLPGDGEPQPLVTLAVTDEDEATSALRRLTACDRGSGEPAAGFAVADGHAVVAESGAVARSALAGAEEASLADHETFGRWTTEAGDPGILTAYISPEAPARIGELAEQSGGEPGLSGTALDRLTRDFEGLAVVVRFADGTVEAELAGGGVPVAPTPAGGVGAGELPATTGAALSLAIADGWLEDYLDALGGREGLPIPPEQLEALLGDSVTVAVDGDSGLGPAVSGEDPTRPRAGVRIAGDPAEIAAAVEKVRAQLGPAAQMLVVERGEDGVALDFDRAYVGELATAGSLGDSERFRAAVPQAERATGLFYVDFEAGGGWVERLVQGHAGLTGGSDAADVRENLRPLRAVGASTWVDGDVQRGLFRLTTD